MPDIAQCHPPLGMHRLARLVGIVVIGRDILVLEEQQPVLPGRYFLAIGIADMQRAMDRLAHAAGVVQPVLGLDQRHADPFRPGVIFVDDRAPPFDHLALDRNGARRGGVECALVAGQVVAGAKFGIELEHPDEMRGHPLAVGHAVLLDRGEREFGIEFLHHHHGAAQALRGGAPAKRRGMIERRGGEIDHAAVCRHARPHDCQSDQRIDGLDVLIRRRRRLHPFGPSGRAGGIEHVLARRLIRDRLRRLRCKSRIVILIAFAADNQQRQIGAVPADPLDHIGELAGRQQEFGVCILQNIADLGRGQPGGNRHHHRARTLRSPDDLQIVGVILHQDGKVIAALQAPRPQQLRKAIGVIVHLAECYGLAAGGHDDGGMVRTRLRMGDGVHWLAFSSPAAPFSTRGLFQFREETYLTHPHGQEKRRQDRSCRLFCEARRPENQLSSPSPWPPVPVARANARWASDSTI